MNISGDTIISAEETEEKETQFAPCHPENIGEKTPEDVLKLLFGEEDDK